MSLRHSKLLEIAQHAIFALLAPLAVVIEALIHGWFEKGNDGNAGLAFLWTILAVYVLAFLIVWLLHETLGWIMLWYEEIVNSQPVHIDSVGRVDGQWVDKVWNAETRELKQGSIITFKSTRKSGFSLKGYTFDFNGQALVDSEPNYFETSCTLPVKNSIIYFFAGEEGTGPSKKPHRGVGYYEFRKSANGNKTFAGAFLIDGEQSYRIVSGEIVEKGEMQTIDEKKKRVLDFLLRK